jgi:hypothetical protein
MIIANTDGNSKQSTKYSWASASVNAAGTAAATALTGVAGFTTLLTNFATTKTRKPRYIKVWSSGAAYVKVNGGDVVTLGATSPFEADDLIVESIGISTNGSAITITVQLQ